MEDQLKQGETLFAEGRIDEAAEFFLSAVEKGENNKEAYNNLGVVAIQKRDVKAAIECFTRSLEIDPFYKTALINYTDLLKALNQLHIAIPLLKKIVEINSNDDKDVSQLLKEAQKFQHSKLDLSGTSSFDKLPYASSNKEPKDMKASMDKQETTKKDNYLTVSNVDNPHEFITEQKKMGYAAFEKGDYVEARRYLGKVLSLAPDAPESHNDLGAVLYSLGDYDAAELNFYKALELSPDFTDAKNNLKSLLDDKNAIRERARNDKSIFLKHVQPELVKHKRGMNICVFADFNIAGILTMLMRLINKYTIHKARCVIVNDDYLSYDKDVTLRPKGRKDLDSMAVAEAEQIVAQADFFHVGRLPVNFGKVDFKKILNKNNCVIQYFGSEYRAKGSQLFKMHTQTGIRGISWWDWTMLDHGLLFYHIDHILDLERINPPISRAMDNIKIVHAPTNRAFKKTDFFLNVMQKIEKKHANVQLILLEGLENSECIRKKQEAHILFDQISVGMYALSALESLAMEQVVLCSLSNFGMSFCPDSPVIPVHQENLYEVLDKLVTHPEKIVQLGKRGREYVKQKHSPERGIMQYTYLWDLIVNGLRLVDHKQNLFIKNSFENKELIELPIV